MCLFEQHNSHVLIPLCYDDIRFDISCLKQTDNNIRCSMIQEYSKFTKTQEEEEEAKRISELMAKIRRETFFPDE